MGLYVIEPDKNNYNLKWGFNEKLYNFSNGRFSCCGFCIWLYNY